MRANIERVLIGSSPQMKTIRKKILRIAKSDLLILLISGESGTGKDLVARLLHAHSYFHNKPFHEINCSVLTDNVFEGASKISKRLNFEGFAHGGTIFFNEITDLDMDLQRDVEKILDDNSLNSKSIRFIFTTNRNLANAVHLGSLTSDLYRKIKKCTIDLPPLRDRGGDILDIARYYLELYANNYGNKHSTLTRNIEKKLLSYRWPGNISELKHLIERFVLLEEKDILLPQEMIDGSWSDMETEKIKPLAQVEREYIISVVNFFDNNKSRAAKALGISRQSVINKFKKYEHLN
ncbi:MAG: sigma 54-interacting transcriptional regulator [bacterium]